MMRQIKLNDAVGRTIRAVSGEFLRNRLVTFTALFEFLDGIQRSLG